MSISSVEDSQSQLSFTSIEDFQSQTPQSPCASFRSSIQTSSKESKDQPSQNIAKPRGSLAKNIRMVLDLTEDEYKGYRVSSCFIIFLFI